MSRGDSEIRHQRVLVLIEQNVVRLDVAMDEPVSMRVVERARNLRGDRRRSLGRERAAIVDSVGERPASEIRHHEKHLVADDSKIGDRADVRMDELRGGLCLSPESLAHVGIPREMRMHDLDDDGAVERDVKRVVHVRHAAFANPVHDAVPATGDMTQRRDRRIRRLSVAIDDYRQKLAAAKAPSGISTVPRSTIRTKHRYPPNCIRTKS